MSTEPESRLALRADAHGVRSLIGALGRARDALRRRADDAVDALLGEDVRNRLARLDVQRGAGGVDPFGFDPQVARYGVLASRAIYRKYFRTEAHGLANVPTGRVLLVANHSGQLPLDALAIAAAMFLDAEPPRVVRSMVEKWTATLPFVSEFFARCGQIVGVPENCIRLLEMEEAVLVFPEGVRGISKTFDQRYRLTDFGLGFMRMALQTGAPVVPVAVIGAEEQYISVANLQGLARLFGAPALPLMPQLLLPGGFLPLPTKYRIYFGEPMHFEGDPDDEDSAIEERVGRVRAEVQRMLNRGLKERRGIFF